MNPILAVSQSYAFSIQSYLQSTETYMEIEGKAVYINKSIIYRLIYDFQSSKILQDKFQLKLNSYICVSKYINKFFQKWPPLSLVYHSIGEKCCFKLRNSLAPRQFLDLIHFSWDILKIHIYWG